MTAEEHLADLKAQMEKHRREDHTPEYEAYLRTLPFRPWHATQRLQFSACDMCQVFLEMIMDAHSMTLYPAVVIKADGKIEGWPR